MSGERRLFPRLPVLVARDLWRGHQSLSPIELSELWRDNHERVVFTASGAPRVTIPELRDLRAAVEQTAREVGFPGEISRSAGALFDARVAETLHREMRISRGEAARNDVWSFLVIALMPDISRWRFPQSGEERFVGGVRNTLQRLWWRAKVLVEMEATEPYGLLAQLPEDALVGIMERPAISSNPLLARVIAKETIRVGEHVRGGQAEDVRRDAFKRVRQRFPVVNFDALSRGDLENSIRAIFDEAIEPARTG